MNSLVELSQKIYEYNLLGNKKLPILKLAIIQGLSDNLITKTILSEL